MHQQPGSVEILQPPRIGFEIEAATLQPLRVVVRIQIALPGVTDHRNDAALAIA